MQDLIDVVKREGLSGVSSTDEEIKPEIFLEDAEKLQRQLLDLKTNEGKTNAAKGDHLILKK